MTNMPEAKLAKEAEICYVSLSMVTDFDCWHPNHDSVEVSDIIETLTNNSSKAQRIVEALPNFLDQEIKFCGSQCSKNSLDNALITAPENRDNNLLKKLDVILERLNKK